MKMTTIRLKPLSVNDSYQGRRFSTPELKDFKDICRMLLPKDLKVPEGKLEIYYQFGFSSKMSDWDNPIKAFQDVLAEFYGFNDNIVYRGIGEKIDVEKGKEFIKFKIKSYGKKN